MQPDCICGMASLWPVLRLRSTENKTNCERTGREQSRGASAHTCVCCAYLLSPVRLPVTPWTAARQAPRSMGFSRQEHWSGYPIPSPGDLPDPPIETGKLILYQVSSPTSKARRQGWDLSREHPVLIGGPAAVGLSLQIKFLYLYLISNILDWLYFIFV